VWKTEFTIVHQGAKILANNSTKIELDSHAEGILRTLKLIIEKLNDNFTTAQELILELAKYLNEKRLCQADTICLFVKKLLQDKIKEGKITSRWIENCLPNEYKRKYSKSELTSHSDPKRIQPTFAGQFTVQEFQDNQLSDGSRDSILNERNEQNVFEDKGDLAQEN
jgi:hypothetical protein